MKLVHAFAAAAALFAAAPALADLPDPAQPATVVGHLNVLQQYGDTVQIAPALTDFGTLTIGGSSVTVGNAPGAYISLVAGTAVSTQSNASLGYDYVVYVPETGSEPTDIADIVNITGTYQLVTSSFSYGSVGISAGDPGMPPAMGQSFSNSGVNKNITNGSFAILGSGTLFGTGYSIGGVMNAAYRGHVTLSAQLSAYAPSMAFIDPLITANLPALLGAGFNGAPVVALSPGVPNGLVGGVPEPANWALMIGGFGLVGLGARRRVRREFLA